MSFEDSQEKILTKEEILETIYNKIKEVSEKAYEEQGGNEDGQLRQLEVETYYENMLLKSLIEKVSSEDLLDIVDKIYTDIKEDENGK